MPCGLARCGGQQCRRRARAAGGALTRARRALPAVNTGTFFAGIWTRVPVCGLRLVRGRRAPWYPGRRRPGRPARRVVGAGQARGDASSLHRRAHRTARSTQDGTRIARERGGGARSRGAATGADGWQRAGRV
jgi:hypothetical protein